MACRGLSFTCPVKYGTMLKPSRCTLNFFSPTVVPLSSLVLTSGSPAMASSVGNMSMWETMPFSTVFALILPGQRTKHGTRQPPSQLLSFCPRNGVLAPSGQVSFSGPLSVEYMTMVLSVTPSSSSFARSSPICSSWTTMRSLYGSCPLLPRFFSATCVRKCMAVELYQRKNGLSALTCFSTQSMAFRDLLVDRLHPLLGQRARVRDRLPAFSVGDAMQNAARAELLLERRILGIVG